MARIKCDSREMGRNLDPGVGPLVGLMISIIIVGLIQYNMRCNNVMKSVRRLMRGPGMEIFICVMVKP